MSCRNCGYEEFDYRNWESKDPVFAVGGLTVVHPPEEDVFIFGRRVAVAFTQGYVNRFVPQGTLFLRDHSQGRKHGSSHP